jgi:gluconokinase
MDGPLTQLGAGGVSSGVASCTIGTSIAFRGGADHRLVDPTRRVWCYPVTRSWWVAGGAGSNGGNILTWLRDRIGLRETVGEIAALAFEVPTDPTLTFVPYLNGERAPLWRPDVRAAFIGLSAHHSSADLAHAALDGIAAAVVELAGAVEALIGAPERVVLTGGFLQEERWVQLMTDALGVATSVPEPDTATSNGIATVAWAGVEDAPLETVFSPRWRPVATPDPAVKETLVAVSERIAAYRAVLWPGE